MTCNRALGLFRDHDARIVNMWEYHTHPPVTVALGHEVFGLKGRVTNSKKTRNKLNKKKAP